MIRRKQRLRRGQNSATPSEVKEHIRPRVVSQGAQSRSSSPTSTKKHHAAVLFTDHDPAVMFRSSEQNDDPSTELLEERYTCRDPFFAKQGIDVKWPAVPRPLLADFLRACSRHGIKATLDTHTSVGGSSMGTFSGVWPLKPLFWKYDDPEHPDTDIGRGILRDLLTWAESLSKHDPVAFAGLGAISPMNEPAHLAGIFGPGSENPQTDSFLPSLPDSIAEQYLRELNDDSISMADGTVFPPFPDGPHLRVFYWLNDAAKTFRASSLPSLGIEFHVNLIETFIANSLAGGEDQKLAMILSWWGHTTTSVERKSWAVMDLHHYHAWSPSCQGTVDGTEKGFTCGDAERTDLVLSRCTNWARGYRFVADKLLGKGAQLASAEFSVSTHHSVQRSCRDVVTLRKLYLAELSVAAQADVDLYFWTWKMPHGGDFRSAWSFTHLLYLLGMTGFSSPDESEIECGGGMFS